MTTEFRDHIDKFIDSFTNDVPKIHYQAFDFSKVQDNRSKLLNLNFDKQKVSFVNLEMIADVFQVFAAVHSALGQQSSRDFSVEVPYRLANSKAIGDALRIFGGFGKAFVLVVSILDEKSSEDLIERISQIENVTKMSQEEMKKCMTNNSENVYQYYFGSANDDEKAAHRNQIGEIVTKMLLSKHF